MMQNPTQTGELKDFDLMVSVCLAYNARRHQKVLSSLQKLFLAWRSSFFT